MSIARPVNVSHVSRIWPRRTLAPLLAVAAFAITGCEGAAIEPKSSAATPDQVQAAEAPARIGVYDSRAVALAWGRSEEVRKQLADLGARHKKAVADGDNDLVAKLQDEAEARQIRMHLQVFSNAPADDAIAHIRDQLGKVASDAGVCAIVPAADYHVDATEIVDVTEAMVKLFDPSPETLKMALKMRDSKPEPIEKVAQIPAANRSN